MKFKLLFLLGLLLPLLSCDKDDTDEQVYDESLEMYFGTWEFSHNTTSHSYTMEFDSLGGLQYVPATSHSDYATTGEVSMGRVLGELKITFNIYYPEDFYYATVLNEDGHLSCAGNCSNLGEGELPPNGYHHIYETEYRVDLGYSSSGGSYATITTWDITGVPL